MTAAELRSALNALGLTQAGGARLLGVDARTMRRWCMESGLSARVIPQPVSRFLRYLIAAGVSPEEVMRALAPFLSSEERAE